MNCRRNVINTNTPHEYTLHLHGWNIYICIRMDVHILCATQQWAQIESSPLSETFHINTLNLCGKINEGKLMNTQGGSV